MPDPKAKICRTRTGCIKKLSKEWTCIIQKQFREYLADWVKYDRRVAKRVLELIITILINQLN